MTKFNSQFRRAFEQGKREGRPLPAKGFKVAEESGELAEALAHKLGWLPLKTMKEPLVGEAADVILAVMDVLRGATPDEVTDEQLLEELGSWIDIKLDKWKNIIETKERNK